MAFFDLRNLLPTTITTTTTTKKRPLPSSPSTTPNPKRRRTVTFGPSTTTTTNLSNPTRKLNPFINPTSQEFLSTLNHFRTLLRDPTQTVASILSSHFTPHEQDLLRPCETTELTNLKNPKRKRQDKALVKIRERNRLRYAELLKTRRFEQWAGKADLGVKLAMAWFGLPVAPMGDIHRKGRGEGGGMEGVDVVGVETGVGSEEKEVLRFLNGYTERVYGRDVGIRELDPKMEAYYVREKGRGLAPGLDTPLRLRGGDAEAGMDCESPGFVADTAPEVDGAPLEELGQVSLRGGSNSGEDDDEDDDGRDYEAEWENEQEYGFDDEEDYAEEYDDQEDDNQGDEDQGEDDEELYEEPTPRFHTVLGGLTSGDSTRWIPLYGYQGVVWFQVDMLYTFVDAVDRLLGLDNRAGVTYNLYLMDKNKTYSTQAERDEFLSDLTGNGITISAAGVGNYSADQLAWEWITERLRALEEDGEADQRILFIAGPDQPIPWTWEPKRSHRVMKIRLEWSDPEFKLHRPDVAYLRMPENPEDVVYTNDFAPWMASICRLLAPGRIEDCPGQPVVPDAFFTVKGQGRLSKLPGTYGGLAFLPELWDAIVDHWIKDKTAPLTLEATVRSELGLIDHQLSDRWHLFLPGAARPYEEQYIFHDEIDFPHLVQRKIMRLLRRSMSGKSFSKMGWLEVYLSGGEFFLAEESPEITIPVADEEVLGNSFEELVKDMVKRKEELQNLPDQPPTVIPLAVLPQFFALRPLFNKYTICDDNESTEPVDWDPRTATLAQFQDLVASIFQRAGGKQRYAPETAWVGITQGRTARGTTPAEHKPKLLISPSTTESEWRALRKLIVEPELFISLPDTESLPRFGNLKTKQPFGYHDIYQTPDELLYRSIEQAEVPEYRRHYDWQLRSEYLGEELWLIRPWQQQPEPLSAAFALEDFPLIPAPDTGLPVASQEERDSDGENMDSGSSSSPSPPPGPPPAPPRGPRPGPPAGPPPGPAPASQRPLEAGGRNAPRPAGPGSRSQPSGSRTRRNPARRAATDAADPGPWTIRKSQPDSVGFPLVTDVERGQRLREYSYAHPLDVRMHMSVPVNAPPVDSLLNVGHDSVPVVSLSVLTPTEVRRLQRDHHDMRNLVLSRTQRCPYLECGVVYPANQPAAMQQHLQNHVAVKCNFCDEPLLEHWSTEQRYEHFVQKHWHVVRSMVPEAGDDEHVQIFDKGRVNHEREGFWGFCPRCGRDHSILDLGADRQHHDNVCYPGTQNRKTDWSACGACGKRIHAGSEGEKHAHRENVGGLAPFCEGCALPLGLFSEAYRVKHLSFCRGHGRDDAKYCPWCGVELGQDVDERVTHIENCARKPALDAQGSIDMADYFFPSPSPVSPADDVAQEEERPAKRRRTGKAVEAAPHAPKTPPKKAKANVPPISTTSRKDAAAEPSGGSISPPPSTSHSKRSQEAWVPPPRPPGPRATSAPAKPASPGKPAPSRSAFTKPTRATAANLKTPSQAKAKAAKAGKPTPPSTTRPTTLKPNPKPTPSPAKPSKPAPTTPTPAPRTPPRRYTTRSATKRKRAADEADAAAPAPAKAPKAPKKTKQPSSKRAKKPRHAAKAARTVSYAEPLVRGASLSGAGDRGVMSRVDEEGLLMPVLKKRRVSGDGGDGYGVRLVGVGTTLGG